MILAFSALVAAAGDDGVGDPPTTVTSDAVAAVAPDDASSPTPAAPAPAPAAPTPSVTTSVAASAAAEARVFVFAFRGDDVDAKALRAIQRDVTEALAELGYEAVSSDDVTSMLDVEAARQAASCEGENSCLSEIAGSLGAALVVTGRVVVIDGEHELALTLLDTSGARVKGRSSARAVELRALRDTSRAAARRLFGIEDAPPPSTSPNLLLIGGIVGVGVGMVGAIGFFPVFAARDAEDAAVTAAAAYEKSGDDDDLRALLAANDTHAKNADAWNSWGVAVVSAGAVVATAGAVAIVAAVAIGE